MWYGIKETLTLFSLFWLASKVNLFLFKVHIKNWKNKNVSLFLASVQSKFSKVSLYCEISSGQANANSLQQVFIKSLIVSILSDKILNASWLKLLLWAILVHSLQLHKLLHLDIFTAYAVLDDWLPGDAVSAGWLFCVLIFAKLYLIINFCRTESFKFKD